MATIVFTTLRPGSSSLVLQNVQLEFDGLALTVGSIISGEVTISSSADYNGDGSVTFADFVLFAVQYGSKVGDDNWEAVYDSDGNDVIDFQHFVFFAKNHGS